MSGPSNNGLERTRRGGVPAARAVVGVSPRRSSQCSTHVRAGADRAVHRASQGQRAPRGFNERTFRHNHLGPCAGGAAVNLGHAHVVGLQGVRSSAPAKHPVSRKGWSAKKLHLESRSGPWSISVRSSASAQRRSQVPGALPQQGCRIFHQCVRHKGIATA